MDTHSNPLSLSDGQTPRTRHVVIVGAGFAGLACARGLAKADVRVTLIDRTNHHLFQPLLYQVATSALAAPDIAAPIRKLLRRQSNVTVLLGNVSDIRVAESAVYLEDGARIEYDDLVLAAGMRNAYFGHDEWEQFAPGLKSLSDAFEMRRRILMAFERAELARTAEERAPFLNFVVVGGGPTGVELAGAIAEIAKKTLARDFRNFDPKDAQVTLVEAGDRLLPSFSPELSASALSSLQELGVDVRLQTMVTDLRSDGVTLKHKHESWAVAAQTCLWGAGVRASHLTEVLAQQTGVPLDRAGRMSVNAQLNLLGAENLAIPNIYVLGDIMRLEQDGKLLPGVAQVALQGGQFVARDIVRRLRNEAWGCRVPAEEFRYFDKGQMATIGRARAVAESGPIKMTGLIAWLAWLLVHVLFLVEFRSRIAVLFEWAYAYFSWNRSSRVVATSQPERDHSQ